MMTQYMLFIFGNTKTEPTGDEWGRFFVRAGDSGLFKGGSAIGKRFVLGDQSVLPTHHIDGYMRFDTDDKNKLIELLKTHPVVMHGGSIELCEMPKM
jgi:hypothetical protein